MNNYVERVFICTIDGLVFDWTQIKEIISAKFPYGAVWSRERISICTDVGLIFNWVRITKDVPKDKPEMPEKNASTKKRRPDSSTYDERYRPQTLYNNGRYNNIRKTAKKPKHNP